MNFIEIENIGPRTIEHWYDERENIDLNPEYQRTSKAWGLPDRQLLIDSILNGLDIPKFYFADFTGKYNKLNKKGLKYAVIDGKQRLEAIFGFIDGEYSLADDFLLISNSDASYAGMSYSQLKEKNPKLIRKLDGFLITTAGVKTDERSLITLLFLRLNKGRPLTGAELRNAENSTTNDILRRIADHTVFKEKVKFSISRLQNFDAASKLLLLEITGDFTDTKRKNLDGIQKATEEQLEQIYRAEERIITVLDGMRQFNEKDPALSSPGLFPVIYWLVRHHPTKIDKIKTAVTDVQKAVRSKDNSPQASAFRLHNRNTNDKNSLKARYEILEAML